MKERKVIQKNRILQVEYTTEYDSQILEHLENTILGTPGALRYQFTQIEEKLIHIPEIHFLLLTRQGKLLGSVGLLPRSFKIDNITHSTWYVRYFSINAPLRKTVKTGNGKKKSREGKVNLIKDSSLPFMKNPERMFENFDQNKKSLVYSYIEKNNSRSVNFSEQMDAVTVRVYETHIFTRLKPRKKQYVRMLSPEEIPDMRNKLRNFYKDYNFYLEENLFFNSHYYVWEEDGEILAGLQVHPELWRIVDMKGKSSKWMLKILPWIPWVRKIFNPEKFRFLAVEGIWYKKGAEKHINELFEGVCYLHQAHFALTWIDKDSDLYREINHHLKFGIIGNSFERAEVDVKVNFNNYTESEKLMFFRNPAYISAYDMI